MSQGTVLTAPVRTRCVRAGLFFCAWIAAAAWGLSLSTGADGSNAQAVVAAGYDGLDVHIGLISQDHARDSHEAFFDKDSQGDPTGSSHAHVFNATDQTGYLPSYHDTAVGGILCSRGGRLYPADRGVAPRAELFSYKVTREKSETDSTPVIAAAWVQNALNQALDDGCTVIVTGIQIAGVADGNSIFSLMYDYYACHHNLFFATAAGNNSTGITIFGDAYNSLTTGGLIAHDTSLYGRVGSGSNPGPTADGRRKPEVTAPSQNQWTPINGDTAWANQGSTAGQTSWAVPHTGGVAALLVHYAAASGRPDAGRNVVIKAAMVNSAFPNIRDKTGLSTAGQCWNGHRGYGRLDAQAALETLQGPQLSPDSHTTATTGWAYESLNGGQSHRYTLEAAAAERLVVTVTWNRQVAWNDSQKWKLQDGHGVMEPQEFTTALADLDLEIRDPDGGVKVQRLSSIDNLEKADFRLDQTGRYDIRVVNQSTNLAAAYGLAFELRPALPGDVVPDAIVDLRDLAALAECWTQATETLAEAPAGIDMNDDGVINLGDFATMARHWLETDPRYYDDGAGSN